MQSARATALAHLRGDSSRRVGNDDDDEWPPVELPDFSKCTTPEDHDAEVRKVREWWDEKLADEDTSIDKKVARRKADLEEEWQNKRMQAEREYQEKLEELDEAKTRGLQRIDDKEVKFRAVVTDKRAEVERILFDGAGKEHVDKTAKKQKRRTIRREARWIKSLSSDARMRVSRTAAELSQAGLGDDKAAVVTVRDAKCVLTGLRPSAHLRGP